MSRRFRGQSQVLPALMALLLAGGAVAFAQRHATLARIFNGYLKADASGAARTVTQDVAARRPLVKIFLTGALERNHQQIPIEKAGAVRPGEVVSFTLNSVNQGSAPAREYRAVGQIPRGTSFVAGSATGDGNTRVSYSIDDGKQFSARPMIDEKQPDGTVRKIQAPVSMYTQVRFEWADPLAAGGKLVTSYQVRVK